MFEQVDNEISGARRAWSLVGGIVVALIVSAAAFGCAVFLGLLIARKVPAALLSVPVIYSAFLLGLGLMVFRKRDSPALTGMLIGFALAFLLNATCVGVLKLWK